MERTDGTDEEARARANLLEARAQLAAALEKVTKAEDALKALEGSKSAERVRRLDVSNIANNESIDVFMAGLPILQGDPVPLADDVLGHPDDILGPSSKSSMRARRLDVANIANNEGIDVLMDGVFMAGLPILQGDPVPLADDILGHPSKSSKRARRLDVANIANNDGIDVLMDDVFMAGLPILQGDPVPLADDILGHPSKSSKRARRLDGDPVPLANDILGPSAEHREIGMVPPAPVEYPHDDEIPVPPVEQLEIGMVPPAPAPADDEILVPPVEHPEIGMVPPAPAEHPHDVLVPS